MAVSIGGVWTMVLLVLASAFGQPGIAEDKNCRLAREQMAQCESTLSQLVDMGVVTKDCRPGVRGGADHVQFCRELKETATDSRNWVKVHCR